MSASNTSAPGVALLPEWFNLCLVVIDSITEGYSRKKPGSRWPYMLAIKLELLVLSHAEDHFFWQNLQVPQAVWNEVTTRSPGARCLTAGPTRSTRPLDGQY